MLEYVWLVLKIFYTIYKLLIIYPINSSLSEDIANGDLTSILQKVDKIGSKFTELEDGFIRGINLLKYHNLKK